MAKKLTLSEIKKSNSLYDETVRVDLTDEVYIDIYPYFDPKKISELIKESTMDSILADKSGIDFDSINKTDWALFLIIYKFTDLGIPNDIKKKVQAFNELVRYEHFTKIINAFPQESIDEVAKRFNIATKNIQLYNEQNQELVEVNE